VPQEDTDFWYECWARVWYRYHTPVIIAQVVADVKAFIVKILPKVAFRPPAPRGSPDERAHTNNE